MAFNEWQGDCHTAWTVEEVGQPYGQALVGGDQDHSWAAPAANWESYYGNSKGNRSHGHPLSQMSAQVPSVKQPPVFHVGMSWFKYEQLVKGLGHYRGRRRQEAGNILKNVPCQRPRDLQRVS